MFGGPVEISAKIPAKGHLQDSHQDPPRIHVKKFRIAFNFRVYQGLARFIMTKGHLQDSRQDPPGIHVKKFRIAFRLIQGLARLIMTFLFIWLVVILLFSFLSFFFVKHSERKWAA